MKARRFSRNTAIFLDSPLHAHLRRHEDPEASKNGPPPAPPVEFWQPGPFVRGVSDSLQKWRQNILHFGEWPGASGKHLSPSENDLLKAKAWLAPRRTNIVTTWATSSKFMTPEQFYHFHKRRRGRGNSTTRSVVARPVRRSMASHPSVGHGALQGVAFIIRLLQ